MCVFVLLKSKSFLPLCLCLSRAVTLSRPYIYTLTSRGSLRLGDYQTSRIRANFTQLTDNAYSVLLLDDVFRPATRTRKIFRASVDWRQGPRTNNKRVSRIVIQLAGVFVLLFAHL